MEEFGDVGGMTFQFILYFLPVFIVVLLTSRILNKRRTRLKYLEERSQKFENT